jgi:uncharacterized tellurite resistance protein B-like protein
MGLFDRLTGQSRSRETSTPTPRAEQQASFKVTVSVGDEVSSYVVPIDLDSELVGIGERPDGPSQSASECWIPAGRGVEVAGRRIGSGFFYLGTNLGAADREFMNEPSLVNPSLVVTAAANGGEPPPHYWPSYEALSSDHRGGYLDWLASPRRVEDAFGAYLFLYLYGLERRLLADPKVDPAAAGECGGLRQELERLGSELSEEDEHRSFATYLNRLLDYLGALDVLDGTSQPEPPLARTDWQVPMTLRLMIGEAAKAKLLLPGELAVSWILTSPEAYLRTPAERCREEFAALFAIRYRERFGEGLELPDGPTLELSYRPASHGVDEVSHGTGLPDLADSEALIEPLRAMGRDCSSELDAYSRWLGRNPDARGSFHSAALLPSPLVAGFESTELDSLRRLLAEKSAGEVPWLLDLGELIELWSHGTEKLPKKETVMVAQLLEGLGYGIEPDQRFGGLSPRRGMTGVIFSCGTSHPQAPSDAYAAASLLLHLLAAVAAADGRISPEEEDLLESQIHGVQELYEGERERLRAHAQWLTRSKPRLAGLAKRLKPLAAAQREAIGQSLVVLAAADGEVAPEEVKVLGKVFELLGLEPESVYSALHAATTDGGSDGPIVVREAGEGPAGYPIPSPPGEDLPQGLDREAIDRKVEETAIVSTILAGIFEDPAEVGAVEDGFAVAAQGPKDGGVDGVDLSFVRELAKRDSWSRQDLEGLAGELGLMVDGALESANERAFELYEEPLFEGEDPVEIDLDVAKEMLK